MRENVQGEATGLRELGKTQRRARILAAAQKHLAEHGYEAMTMAGIARDAEVAAGTVFQYAATKPELLMMVIVERWRPVVRAALTSGGECDDPRRRIRELLQPFVQATLEDPKLAVTTASIVLFGADGRHRREALSLVDALEETLARLLTELCVSAPEVAARLIVSGTLVELNRTRTGRAEEHPIEHRIAQLVDVVVGPH